jgi:hypothetical protein
VEPEATDTFEAVELVLPDAAPPRAALHVLFE